MLFRLGILFSGILRRWIGFAHGPRPTMDIVNISTALPIYKQNEYLTTNKMIPPSLYTNKTNT